MAEELDAPREPEFRWYHRQQELGHFETHNSPKSSKLGQVLLGGVGRFGVH